MCYRVWHVFPEFDILFSHCSISALFIKTGSKNIHTDLFKLESRIMQFSLNNWICQLTVRLKSWSNSWAKKWRRKKAKANSNDMYQLVNNVWISKSCRRSEILSFDSFWSIFLGKFLYSKEEFDHWQERYEREVKMNFELRWLIYTIAIVRFHTFRGTWLGHDVYWWKISWTKKFCHSNMKRNGFFFSKWIWSVSMRGWRARSPFVYYVCIIIRSQTQYEYKSFMIKRTVKNDQSRQFRDCSFCFSLDREKIYKECWNDCWLISFKNTIAANRIRINWQLLTIWKPVGITNGSIVKTCMYWPVMPRFSVHMHVLLQGIQSPIQARQQDLWAVPVKKVCWIHTEWKQHIINNYNNLSERFSRKSHRNFSWD